MLRLIGTSRSSIASSCPPFLRGRGCLQVTSSASFTSRLVGLACVSRTSQGDGECRGLAQQDIVFPRLLSLRLHDGASRLVQLVALFALAFAFAYSINPISDSAPPPPASLSRDGRAMDSGRNPHSRPPPKPPPSPVFRIRPPPHSPIPRSGFDADQAGITAQVCVHCGIGIPIRLICTTASDEPGTYPHTFSTAHSPSPTSQSKSRLHLFLPPHPPPLSLRSPRTSHLAVPASFVSLPTSSPNLLPPPDCLPQQGAVLTPSPPQPVRRPLESPPLSLDAIPSTRLREGRKRVQRLRVGPRVASTHKLFFFFATRTTDDYPFQLRHDTFPETTPAHPCGSRLRVCWRKD